MAEALGFRRCVYVCAVCGECAAWAGAFVEPGWGAYLWADFPALDVGGGCTELSADRELEDVDPRFVGLLDRGRRGDCLGGCFERSELGVCEDVESASGGCAAAGGFAGIRGERGDGDGDDVGDVAGGRLRRIGAV